jgi:hypothetical protein
MRTPLVIAILVAAIFFTGCIIVPAGSTRRPLASADKEFSFVKVGQTSRSEITNRLGAFDEYYDDLHVGAYRLNEITRTRLWLALGIIPVGTSKVQDRDEIAYFKFDSADLVTRHRIVWEVGAEYGRFGAERWAGKQK